MAEDIKKQRIENSNVLIVDDDESICKYLTDLLSLRGFKPITANSGEKAIELLSRGDRFLLTQVSHPKLQFKSPKRAFVF